MIKRGRFCTKLNFYRIKQLNKKIKFYKIKNIYNFTITQN